MTEQYFATRLELFVFNAPINLHDARQTFDEHISLDDPRVVLRLAKLRLDYALNQIAMIDAFGVPTLDIAPGQQVEHTIGVRQ